MQRICKYCGKIYEGDPGGSCCPECAAAQRSTTVRDRVCRACGAIFPGGPRAWYCPVCRAERQRRSDREHKARSRVGKVRRIGSMDLCVICGRPYTVAGSLQRYCPDCAPEAVQEADRAASLAWGRDNTTPAQRRETRRAAAAELRCAVCGKPFTPRNAAVTCSKACSEALRKQRAAQWEHEHRDARNQYRRALRAQEKEKVK